MSTPKTLIEAVTYYSNPDVCHALMIQVKWPKGIECPHCGAKGDRIGQVATRRMIRCKDCRKQISTKVDTIFEDSPLPLTKWFVAVWCIANAKNGISSCELARALGVTQKTAWTMLSKIKLARRILAMMDRRILPVVGKEGYFVGDDGSVWTTWGKGPGAKADRPMRKMSVRMDHEGYRRVTFRDRTSVKVGVLVLTAFVGPCPDGLECCHGPNNDPADDRLCNLRWDAHKENIEDKRRNGTMAVSKGHGRAKLDDEQIRDILALRGQDTQVSVARRFGVSRGYVGQLWSGARKRVTVHG